MAKKKITYVCRECGAKSPTLTGKCLKCGSWSSLEEEIPESASHEVRGLGQKEGPQKISAISMSQDHRQSTGLSELDRVLGGGLMPGSLTLIGGDPGIGKSTLLLQTLSLLEAAGEKTLYISGEESAQQIAHRAHRLGMPGSQLPIYCETNLETILDTCEKYKPNFIVLDSIQTIYLPELAHSPGAEVQLRSATLKLMVYAKSNHCSVILVGHVTKGGVIAGPKLIEHMVDTVIYFEGEPHSPFRLLRSIKNRFGATHEIGVFEMRSSGLIPIENPSVLFSHDGGISKSGSVVTCNLEGSRPILVEIQALVNKSNYSQAQRVAMGIDAKRVHIILALLEKYAGIEVGLQDVFLSAAGGFKISEPSADLAIACAVASNHLGKKPLERCIFLGELSLSGEVRPISQWEVRAKEASRLGYEKVILPYPAHTPKPPKAKTTELIYVKSLQEAIEKGIQC